MVKIAHFVAIKAQTNQQIFNRCLITNLSAMKNRIGAGEKKSGWGNADRYTAVWDRQTCVLMNLMSLFLFLDFFNLVFLSSG